MSEQIINSNFLHEQMLLKIYIPIDFSDLYKYQVCIMQDGDDYYQIGRIARLSDQLHSNQEIDRTIFVGIHYQDKHDRQKKYHPSGEKQEAYSQFLAHEVAPLLDRIFPTHQMGQTRILMGDSLAGTIALMTAMKYPHTFGKVVMQSPYVDEKVLQMVQHTNTLLLLDIYHTIGSNETSVTTTTGLIKDFLTPNQALHQLLTDHGGAYQYYELPAGEHTWKYWQKDLPRALKIML